MRGKSIFIKIPEGVEKEIGVEILADEFYSLISVSLHGLFERAELIKQINKLKPSELTVTNLVIETLLSTNTLRKLFDTKVRDVFFEQLSSLKFTLEGREAYINELIPALHSGLEMQYIILEEPITDDEIASSVESFKDELKNRFSGIHRLAKQAYDAALKAGHKASLTLDLRPVDHINIYEIAQKKSALPKTSAGL